MKTETIAIIITLIIAFVGVIVFGDKIIGGNSREQYHSRIEHDLCYSIKTNKLLFEDYKRLRGYDKRMDNFERALEEMENRNWMGCEE